MKKSDLKSGMMLDFDGNHCKVLVLLNATCGDCMCDLTPKKCNIGGYRHYNYYGLEHLSEDLCEIGDYNIIGNVSKVYGLHGEILWERTPEKTYELDGIKYSESTLRSIIKKATE